MEDYHLDEGAYNALLKLLNNQYHTEKSGNTKDMDFLFDDLWLKDTAVISNVVKRNGMWEIHLVFALNNKPHKLIRRVIASLPNKQKADISAHYMQRMAAKDQRGTIRVNSKGFNICTN